MRKLIIHIGLPKTGTTFLQKRVFPFLKSVAYVGRRYDGRKPDLAFTFINCLHAGKAGFARKALAFVDQIHSFDHDIVMLSEEQILIDTPKGDWQENLSRLADLVSMLDGVDVHVVAAFRDPISCAYSFFVERYYLLKKEYSNFETFVLKSNQAKLFDFGYFVATMDELFGKQNYRIFSYEQLSRNDGGVASIVQHLELDCTPVNDATAFRENVKKKEGRFYYSNPINVRTWLASTSVGKLVRQSFPRWSYNWISTLLHQIPMGKSLLVRVDDCVDAELKEILNTNVEMEARPTGHAVEYFK